MTEVTRAYKFIVYDTDESTPDLTFLDDAVVEPPDYGAWRVRPLDGSSESEPFSVRVVDESEQVTSNLSDANGRADLVGRLWELQVNEDAAGFSTVGKGRITGVQMAGDVASYDFQCGDERFLTRQREIYRDVGSTPTTQIYPPGLRSDWYEFATAPSATWIVDQVNANEVMLRSFDAYRISGEVVDWIENDQKLGARGGSSGGSDGNFTHLRFLSGGSEYEILVFDADLNGRVTGALHQEQVGGVVPDPIWVAWPSSGLTQGDAVTGVLYAPNAPPSSAVPYHVGGITGVDMFTTLKDHYDTEGVRYDSGAFSSYDESTNPQGLISHPEIPKGYLRLTGPITLGSFEERLFKTHLTAPFPNASGEIYPRKITLPQGTNPSSLTQVTVAEGKAPHPTWQQVGSEAVTVYQASMESIRELPGRERAEKSNWAGDGLEARDAVDEATHDNVSTVGRYVYRSDYFGVVDPDQATRLRDQQSTEIFHRYGDGPIRGVFHGLSALSSVAAGDFVVLDISSYPDIATQTRGGKRLVQVMEHVHTPSGSRLEYADAGVDDNALSAPSVAIAKNASRPKHDVDVTISSLGAGETYQLFARPDSDPYEYYGEGTGNETVTLKNFPAGSTVEVQLRAAKASRTRSAWSASASVALDSLSAPSGLATNVSGRTIELTWTNGEADYRVMPTLSNADFLSEPLEAGATRFVFTELDASTLYTVGVKHVDEYGGESAETTTTDTTSTATQLSAPRALTLLQAAPSSGDVVYPTDTPYGVGMEVAIRRTEAHAKIEVQVDTDSGFGADPHSYFMDGKDSRRIHLEPDDTTRYIRARQVKTGFTASAWTATVSGKPTPFAREAGLSDGFAGGYAFLTLDTDNDVILSVGTRDPDTDTAYYELGTGSYTEPTTGSSSIARSAMPYEADQGVVLSEGDSAYLWLKFHNDIKGFGQEVKQRITLGEFQPKPPTLGRQSESETSTTGTFAVTLYDPDGVADTLWYRTKSGQAAWSGLFVKDATPNHNSTYSETVSMEEDHLSFVEWRLAYTIGGQTFYIQQKSSGFDKGKLPYFSLQIVADEDWNVSCQLTGDFDFASAKIAQANGSAPSTPSDATVQARAAVNTSTGRNVAVSDVDSAYGDFPVALAAGETIIVAAFGYSGSGGGGNESTTKIIKELYRPNPEPLLENATLSVFDNGAGSYVEYTFDWTPNAAVNNTDHDIEFRMGHEGSGTEAISTESSPATTTQEVVQDAGAGDGAADRHWGEMSLVDNSGNVLQTLRLSYVLSIV